MSDALNEPEVAENGYDVPSPLALKRWLDIRYNESGDLRFIHAGNMLCELEELRRTPAASPGGMTDPTDCVEFYDLMQTYRHTPIVDQMATCSAYEAVRDYVRSAIAKGVKP